MQNTTHTVHRIASIGRCATRILLFTGGFSLLASAVFGADVIDEDFSAGASNFTVISGGTWSATGGEYVLSSPSTSSPAPGNGNISVHDTSLGGDWTLSVDASTTATGSLWNDFSIIFGYQDDENYYFVSFCESNDGNTSGIFKMVSNSGTQLVDITSAISGGTTYTVEIIKSGSGYTVKLDTTTVATVSDSTYSSGKVGFGTRNDGATFDDLLVTSPDSEAPSVPTGLSADDVSTTTVDLSWSASTDNVGVAGYKVYTNGANPVSVTGTSTTISGLTQNTSYAFTVSAYDAASNESSQSSGVNVTTDDGEAPSVPTGLSADDVTTTTVDLSWSASTDNVGVAGYKVYTDGANPVSVAGTSTTISGLTQNTSYAFTVSAYDAASNESSQSSGVNVTTDDGQAPSVPTGLTASNISSTTVDLDWNASTDNVGVAGYMIYTGGSNPVSVTGTSVTVTGLDPSTGYTFTVSAYDAASNESSQSGGVNVTTDSGGGGPLIDEDFATSASSFTEVAGGTWSVSGGRYVLSSPANGGTGLLGNISVHDTAVSGNDYSVSAVIRITGTTSAWNDAALIFGYQDANNYYYVSLNESNDGGTKGVFKVVSGSPTELADLGSVSIASDTDYTVEVTRSGSSIVVELNSSQVASTSDSTFTGGQVGFGSKNDGAEFDDLVAYGSAGAGNVADPQFSPGGGSYSSAQNVTITTVTSGATIRYTTDGSTPTSTSGTVYSGAVAISSTTTLKAIAYKSGMNDSNVTSDTYTITASQVETPQFSPGGGVYSSTQNVTITTATSGATIRYTTDGSTPTSSYGTVYSSAVSVSSTTTLKAIAYKSGMSDSGVATATYTFSGGLQYGTTLGTTNQITSNGITWTFDSTVTYGTFITGDYWIVGPVGVTSITNSLNSSNYTPRPHQNGSMVNPLVGHSRTAQGYDDGLGSYNSSLNAGRPNGQPVSSSNKLNLQADDTLVSQVSWLYNSSTDKEPGCPAFNGGTNAPRPVTRSAGVLTVLDQAPPDYCFRPPYAGDDNSILYNWGDLDWDQLEDLTPPTSNVPNLSTLENKMRKPWIDHVFEYLGAMIHPSEHMPNYGRDMAHIALETALMLHLDFSQLSGSPSKNQLLINLVQYGIDSTGVADNGGGWRANGGHGFGRKFPILFAGLMLDDTHMKQVGVWGQHDGTSSGTGVEFQDFQNLFYVTQAEVNITNGSGWNPDDRCSLQAYTTGDIGTPEWGIRHSYRPQEDNGHWGACYRSISNGVYPGFALAVFIMEAESLWNHDASLDYSDRVMTTDGGGTGTNGLPDFAKEMWALYR